MATCMAFVCLLLGVLLASDCYHGAQHLKNDLIDAAILSIDSNFDLHICHPFKDLDCSNHVLPHDEPICASDGLTYSTHCEYAKARCYQIFDKNNYVNHILINPLTIVSHGPCGASAPSTSTVASTKSTTLSVNSGKGPDVSTVSVDNVLKSVFCKNVWSINCGQDFSIVCGSDGKYYPNECELLKWQCDNPLLRKASDTSVCG